MIVGALIIFFLIVEPHGLARLWQIAKQKLRVWPYPVLKGKWTQFRRRSGVSGCGKPRRAGAQSNAGACGRRSTKGRNAMRLKYLVLGAAFAGAAVRRRARHARPSHRTASMCRFSPTGPGRSPAPAFRSPTACTTISQMLNERDGGIGGVKLVVEECETGYDTKKGVECYEQVKAKKPVVDQSVFDRHHAAADPEGRGRQDSGAVDGLWPVGVGGRRRLPVDLQSAGDLLGRPVDDLPLYRRQGRRPRQAQGQDHRLHLLRRRLWPRADPAA